MVLKARRFYTFIEETLSEAGQVSADPLRKVATVAIIENPFARRYVQDLLWANRSADHWLSGRNGKATPEFGID